MSAPSTYHPHTHTRSLRQLADFYRDRAANRAFKAFAGLALVGHAAGALAGRGGKVAAALAVVPAHAVVSARVWTPLTAGFYEVTPLMV